MVEIHKILTYVNALIEQRNDLNNMKKCQNLRRPPILKNMSIGYTLRQPLKNIHTRSLIDLDATHNYVSDQHHLNQQKNRKYLSSLYFLQSQQKIRPETPSIKKTTTKKQQANNLIMNIKDNSLRNSNQNKKNKDIKENSKDQNYALLVKLRDYIEEIKIKQQKWVQEGQKIKQENQKLKLENQIIKQELKKLNQSNTILNKKLYNLNDNLKVMENQHCQAQNVIKSTQKKLHQIQKEKELIVQSLKRVINQQMAKIIHLQRQILHNKTLNNLVPMTHKRQISSDSLDKRNNEIGWSKLSESYQVSQAEGQSNKIQNNEIIMQVTQENQTQNVDTSNDNILAEVDNYLSKIRNKAQ